MNSTTLKALAVAILSAFLALPSYAIEITTNTDASALAAAISAGAGLTVTGATLSGQTATSGAVSSGTYTNTAGTYNNVGSGIVLSTGDVRDYASGPSTSSGQTTAYGVIATPAQEALLDPITGGSLNHRDVTQLDITFTSTTGQVFFNVVWGSDEFPEFIGSSFIDAFGIYLNGTNIAFLGGLPINLDHPNVAAFPGTELDGVLLQSVGNPIVAFSGATIAGANTLTFIVADSGDFALDTTVFISSLAGTAQVDDNGPLPEPATLLLLGAALACLARVRRRRI
jgi:PEP-CTERM motif-containing protein